MLATTGDVDSLGLRAAELLLAGQVCCAVDYCAATESTNSLALAEINDRLIPNKHCPKLFLTDRQTAGRGRHGRTWVSNEGTLTFSLVINRRMQADRSSKLLSLAVGVGIARSLEFEFAPIQVKLKWPNDVHLGGGKVAGVLLETNQNSPDRVVIGVGVNVSESPDLGDDPAASHIQSVAHSVGRRVDRYELLEPIVVNIQQAIGSLVDDTDDLVAEFRSKCLLTGQTVSFRDREGDNEGVCRGVSDAGELIVETATGQRLLQSGEARLVRLRSGD